MKTKKFISVFCVFVIVFSSLFSVVANANIAGTGGWVVDSESNTATYTGSEITKLETEEFNTTIYDGSTESYLYSTHREEIAISMTVTPTNSTNTIESNGGTAIDIDPQPHQFLPAAEVNLTVEGGVSSVDPSAENSMGVKVSNSINSTNIDIQGDVTVESSGESTGVDIDDSLWGENNVGIDIEGSVDVKSAGNSTGINIGPTSYFGGIVQGDMSVEVQDNVSVVSTANTYASDAGSAGAKGILIRHAYSFSDSDPILVSIGGDLSVSGKGDTYGIETYSGENIQIDIQGDVKVEGGVYSEGLSCSDVSNLNVTTGDITVTDKAGQAYSSGSRVGLSINNVEGLIDVGTITVSSENKDVYGISAGTHTNSGKTPLQIKTDNIDVTASGKAEGIGIHNDSENGDDDEITIIIGDEKNKGNINATATGPDGIAVGAWLRTASNDKNSNELNVTGDVIATGKDAIGVVLGENSTIIIEGKLDADTTDNGHDYEVVLGSTKTGDELIDEYSADGKPAVIVGEMDSDAKISTGNEYEQNNLDTNTAEGFFSQCIAYIVNWIVDGEVKESVQVDGVKQTTVDNRTVNYANEGNVITFISANSNKSISLIDGMTNTKYQPKKDETTGAYTLTMLRGGGLNNLRIVLTPIDPNPTDDPSGDPSGDPSDNPNPPVNPESPEKPTTPKNTDSSTDTNPAIPIGYEYSSGANMYISNSLTLFVDIAKEIKDPHDIIVQVDGVTVSPANYRISFDLQNSRIEVTFFADYIKTLSAGMHLMTVKIGAYEYNASFVVIDGAGEDITVS